MTKTSLEKEFSDRFQRNPTHVFFCPGRVNLIGEHIDYNGGEVMPCAISLGTYVAVAINDKNEFNFQSIEFNEQASFPLREEYVKEGKAWFNYPLGVIDRVLRSGATLKGLDMLFMGDLPIGAGLSSSASIEVLMSCVLNDFFQLGLSGPDMAILSKKVENEFIGLNCGIMDQFAVAMGKKDNAILLNCDSLFYEYLPFSTGEYTLAIINSNKQRVLSESKYNERFAECGAALVLLQRELNIGSLCEISSQTFEEHRHLINDPELSARAKHVITENERVQAARTAMVNGDMPAFGKLMYASHKSLQYDYEVSGKELDTIVDFCRTYEDCIGARMTGAGFGGCAIALVKRNSFAEFSAQLSAYYHSRIGYAPEVFASEVGEGAREV